MSKTEFPVFMEDYRGYKILVLYRDGPWGVFPCQATTPNSPSVRCMAVLLTKLENDLKLLSPDPVEAWKQFEPSVYYQDTRSKDVTPIRIKPAIEVWDDIMYPRLAALVKYDVDEILGGQNA
jgi:hypothetical protein